MGLQAELLPVFGWPAAIEALMHQVPFIAMIDVASLYATTPMFQWYFRKRGWWVAEAALCRSPVRLRPSVGYHELSLWLSFPAAEGGG